MACFFLEDFSSETHREELSDELRAIRSCLYTVDKENEFDWCWVCSAIGQYLLEKPLVPANTVTPNFQSLPEDVLLSPSPLLKYVYQIFSTQSLSTQKISLKFKTH